MEINFRSEVFRLCNILQKNIRAKEIGTLVHDLSVNVENKQTGIVKNNLHGDFAYVAKHSHNQFHGYLFVDDNADTLGSSVPFKVEHLTKEERLLIEQGHRTVTKFVDLCLEEIHEKTEIVAEAINPYYLYNEVNCNQLVKPLLSDDEMRNAVHAFKSGKTYKAFIGANVEYIFQKMNRSQMRILVGATEKEINKSFGDDVPSDLREFSIRLMGREKYKDITDAMFSYAILIIALKESLGMACQLLYEAICGGDLIVLNNDNIINIENHNSNSICEIFKVLIQGIYLSHVSDGIRSVVLLDCDPMYGGHIHKFGMIVAMTCNFAADMGDTTKYTFVTINEEMIHIHNITDNIIKIGLPKVIVK